jgi:hypothetical protein
MDWSNTLKTTAGALAILSAILALGSIWIPYTESLWRISVLGVMVVLTIRIRERNAKRGHAESAD